MGKFRFADSKETNYDEAKMDKFIETMLSLIEDESDLISIGETMKTPVMKHHIANTLSGVVHFAELTSSGYPFANGRIFAHHFIDIVDLNDFINSNRGNEDYRAVLTIDFNSTGALLYTPDKYARIYYDKFASPTRSSHLDEETLDLLGLIVPSYSNDLARSNIRILDKALNEYRGLPFGVIVRKRVYEDTIEVVDLTRTILSASHVYSQYTADSHNLKTVENINKNLASKLQDFSQSVFENSHTCQVLIVNEDMSTEVYRLEGNKPVRFKGGYADG